MNAVASARDQRGYTLLEVLVAFTLLAIGLGLLLAILSGGVRAVANASDTTRATLYADSMFATLGADKRLQAGHSAGILEGGKYHWTLDITPFVPPDAAPPPGQQGGIDPSQAQGVVDNVMVRVLLQMQWGGGGTGKTLRVETLRAYSPPQDAGLQQ
jgi:general secretion pathway protein I